MNKIKRDEQDISTEMAQIGDILLCISALMDKDAKVHLYMPPEDTFQSALWYLKNRLEELAEEVARLEVPERIMEKCSRAVIGE